MLPEFQRTTRALAADRGPAALGVGLALLAGLGWSLWLVLGEVTLYESSAVARVTAEGVARLGAPVSAEVASVEVVLGQRVAAGALLVQLDDRELRLQAEAARARVEGLEARLAAMAEAEGAARAGRDAGARASAAGLGAARAALEEAEVRAEEARASLERLRRLAEAGAVSAAELDAARSERDAREARVRALERELGREAGALSQEARAGEATASREAEARLAMEVELAAARAERSRLHEALADRAVRAPVAGVVGELASVVPGQRVEAGAPLAVVVPEAPPVVEARFAPEGAVGRVAPGQQARVQVQGSAGGGMGARRAEVLRVGTEPGEDGLVAVTLGLAPAAGLEHGLVARVEVEVERVSPLELLARAAGQAPGAP